MSKPSDFHDLLCVLFPVSPVYRYGPAVLTLASRGQEKRRRLGERNCCLIDSRPALIYTGSPLSVVKDRADFSFMGNGGIIDLNIKNDVRVRKRDRSHQFGKIPFRRRQCHTGEWGSCSVIRASRSRKAN